MSAVLFRRVRRPLISVFALVALLSGAVVTPASAAPLPVVARAAAPVADGIPIGKTLWTTDHLRSRNGKFKMVLQPDGNVVVYEGSKAHFNTATFGKGRSKLSLQRDGNLVLRTEGGTVTWHTNTANRGVTKLVLNNAGTLILYNAKGGAVWTSAWKPVANTTQQAGKFYLPFPKGVGWRISQAPGGSASHHSGNSRYAIDFSMPTGSTITASKAGTVKEAKWISGGGGNAVLLDHGNNQCTLYAHLSSFSVRVGQKVATGATLALSGATGNASGPHLHFSLVTCSYGAASVISTVELGTNYRTGTIATSKNG